MGLSEKHISQLINGKVPLTVDIAFRLERVLGGTATFWLRRETIFREHLARKRYVEQCASWTGWLDDLPVKELMKSDAIDMCRITEKSKPDIVEACLRFFGVASPDEWTKVYGGMQVDFRRTCEEQSDLGAITAWLRLGEQEAEQYDVPKYDRARFEQVLMEIRKLTVEDPQVFEPQMRTLLRTVGVTLVLVPAIPRAHVSGVARWLSASRPLIQLSLDGKNNDRFWFTFFHEAAHVLLHGANAEERKLVFLDDMSNGVDEDQKEREANSWAAEFLIPKEQAPWLSGLKNKAAVRAFANELGIHSAIVVGRLQHEDIIPQSWMNDLKVSFKLASSPVSG